MGGRNSLTGPTVSAITQTESDDWPDGIGMPGSEDRNARRDAVRAVERTGRFLYLPAGLRFAGVTGM